VAELAVGLILAAFRQLPWSDARLKAGAWQRRPGLELAGRTLGVVGLGQIGRRVALTGAALGMRVVGHDAMPDATWSPPTGFGWRPLDDLLAESDVVTLHAPPAAQPLVDAPALARMRRGNVLVNTARAELVDDGAVLDALDSGRLAAYAVDAFATEPPTDLGLVRHDQVIATPHIGGFTRESIERATEEAVSAILRVVASGARVGA
jgi:D-3-phosphoglycerate dehydrogenase